MKGLLAGCCNFSLFLNDDDDDDDTNYFFYYFFSLFIYKFYIF